MANSSKQQHCSGSNSSIATHRAAAAAAMHGSYIQIHTRTLYSSLQYTYNLSGPGTLWRNHTRCLKKRDEKKTVLVHQKKNKTSTPEIEPPTSYSQGEHATFQHPLSYMITCHNYMYPYVRPYNSDILTKKRKEHPPQGDGTSTAEGAPGRVGEMSKVRQIEQTPHRMVDLISS